MVTSVAMLLHVNTLLPLIRVDNGHIVKAEVVAMPFFDPENKRQEL